MTRRATWQALGGIAAVLVVVAGVLVAKHAQEAARDHPIEQRPVAPPLYDTEWQLRAIQVKGASVPFPTTFRVWLHIDAHTSGGGHALLGNDGCNRVWGTLAVHARTIQAPSGLAGTTAGCVSTPHQVFHGFLRHPVAYRADARSLRLTVGTSTVLTFRPSTAFPRRGQLIDAGQSGNRDYRAVWDGTLEVDAADATSHQPGGGFGLGKGDLIESATYPLGADHFVFGILPAATTKAVFTAGGKHTDLRLVAVDAPDRKVVNELIAADQQHGYTIVATDRKGHVLVRQSG